MTDYRLLWPVLAFVWVCTLMLAYGRGLDRMTETALRATQTAGYWQTEAERCYASVAPGVYLMQRGYRVLRAATQRRPGVEVGEVDE